MDMFGKYSETLPVLDSGMVSRLQIDKRGRIIVSSGDDSVIYTTVVELDTAGGIVPVHKGVTNTYDPSGNLQTQTVKNGSTWIRTYTYTNGEVTSDSGWVRQ
jgi:hypothetical protein